MPELTPDISITDHSTSYVGQDATRVFQAKVVRSALKSAKIGLRMNRQMTPTALLRTAGNITGQTFKRGQYDAAIEALTEWIEKASLPLVVEDTRT